jgi:alkylation response protein AidB-like acyl-CoA dehydrogenase
VRAARIVPEHEGASSPSERAQSLKDLLAAQAPDQEALGRLSDPTLSALRQEKLFSLWVPEEFGGLEAWPLESLKAIEALSYGDGSSGWVLMASQVSMGTAAAYLPEQSAAAIFSQSHPIVAGQGAPNGRAEVVPGGFRLSGSWSYGSGILHAEHVHTGAVVFENGAPRKLPGTQQVEIRIFILPVRHVKLQGNWDVLGLRATGSVDYRIEDVFVPEDFTHLQSAKIPRQGGALYRLGIWGLGSIGHTAFALGVARRALDEIASIARAEKGRPSIIPQHGGGESFHEQFGRAEAQLRAARAFVHETWAGIEASLRGGNDVSTREFTLLRLALNHSTTVAVDVCTFAYTYGGGTALRAGTLQRCVRDMMAGMQHLTTSPAILRDCGRELLEIAHGQVWSPRGLIDNPSSGGS